VSLPSPCVGICEVGRDSGRCRGCHRTLKEIKRWTSMTDEERHAVMQRVATTQEPRDD
jgi:hypothetical protein